VYVKITANNYSSYLGNINFANVFFPVESEGTNCENLPATHVFLKKMRAWIDQYYPGRVLLAEACQLPNAVREYFGDGDGDEFHMGFHFPVMPHIYMSMAKRSCSTLKKILMDTPLVSKSELDCLETRGG
jgi:maltose alpha-D-glucosyltransferase/alpha-amylase